MPPPRLAGGAHPPRGKAALNGLGAAPPCIFNGHARRVESQLELCIGDECEKREREQSIRQQKVAKRDERRWEIIEDTVET